MHGFDTHNHPVEIDPDVPAELQTIKAWIALNVMPGKSGLLFRHRHKEEKPGFTIVSKDGLNKPFKSP